MKLPYKSQDPHTGILNYELQGNAIIIEFAKGKSRYLYNDRAPGPAHVQAMRRLAAEGKGLSTYISRHIGKNYAAKLPLDTPTDPLT